MKYLVLLTLLLTACSGSPVDPRPDPTAQNHLDGEGDNENDADGESGDDEEGDDEEGDDEEGDGYDHEEPSTDLLETGAEGFLLRGTVLTPDGVIEAGEVLVIGEHIHCVAEDCSAESSGRELTILETTGVISPGLVDAHNHLPYNFLPPWLPSPGSTFSNRYQWIDDASYRSHISPYGDNRSSGTHFCPAAQWGELRSLVHGTTTIQGQSMIQRCIIGGVRNADNNYHHLGHNHMRTTIASPRDITDSEAQNLIESFERENNPATRYAVHMAEGYAGNNIEMEFESFAGRDTRTNRHQGISLLDWGTAILIHSIILNTAQLEEAALTNSMIVWSPSSNFALYGVTAPIEEILEFGILTALGPDWTVSGAFDMLEEMRVAQRYAEDQEIEALTPRKIWEMATFDGADVVGLGEHIGRLQEGYVADLAIFRRSDADPHQSVINSRATHIDLVMIGGEIYYGDAGLSEIARNEYCEALDACGAEKFICVKEGPDADDRGDETKADIRQQLIDIMADYGREDELLDLIVCGI